MEGMTRVAAAVVLYFTFFATDLEMGSAARINTSASTDFIRTSCRTTSFPAVCFSSLAGYASEIQSSPNLIAQAALSVTLMGSRSASAMMSKLSTGSGLKPGEIAAMKDCIENVRDSVDEIRKSIGEMRKLGDKDFGMHISNMQTWMSAALTDEDTCMDGFAGKAMDGNLRKAVRAKILNVAQMTSNALALVNSLASIQGSVVP